MKTRESKRETEKEKEPSPQTPYKEKQEGEREAPLPLPPRARAREAVVDLSRPPTLEEFLAFTEARNYTDEAFNRKWFDTMQNELFWCYPKTGRPLAHWIAYFRCCYRMRNIVDSDTFNSRPRRGVSQVANTHANGKKAW